MMRSLLTFLLLTILSSGTFAQTQNERKLNRLFDKLTNARKDSARVMALCDITGHYYSNRKEVAYWMDSVVKYSSQALELSRKSGFSYGAWYAIWQQMTSYLMYGNHKKTMSLLAQVPDSHAINALWEWARYYSDPIYSFRINYDSAFYFNEQARVLSEKMKNPKLISLSHNRLAVLYCRKGDTSAALKQAGIAASYYKKPDETMAIMWYNMGSALPLAEKYYAFKINFYERCMAMHRQLNFSNKLNLGRLYMSMGDIDDYTGNTDEAERKFLEAERLLKEAKDKQMYLIHIRLYDFYFYKGNYNRAVYSAFEGLKSAEASGLSNLHQFYLYIGNSYLDMGQVTKSIEYYEKAFASARKSDKKVNGVLIKRMARAMVANGQATAALDFVHNANREFITPYLRDSITKWEALGICHMALKQYDEAEKYYLMMEKFVPYVDKMFAAIVPYVLGKFYYETQRYDKASPYLIRGLQTPKGFLPQIAFSEMSLMMYRIDSSRHQYESALTHFRRHKTIEDSVFNSTKTRQIEELRIQYDIDKKEKELSLQQKDIELLTRQKLLQQALAEQKSKDVLLKQQSIDLLTQQKSLQEVITGKQQQELAQKEKELQLQQENINLLHNRELLQESQLKQAHFIKRMTIGGIVLLLVIVGLLYNQYRIKHRNNRAISEKNERLNNLLEEKEWLLKEVHHRVKNNLQVVSSLLQSQSVFLKDEALAAVHDSQHRVQAMSLIHQKLYQTDNISTINMGVYIPELVDYLKDSFVTRTRIVFVMDIAPAALDVTQAIPLGLIINEAVTNIFKHAFPGRDRGQVHLSLKELGKDELLLDIADNGVGLQADPDLFPQNSLGLNLMKGLCRDFNGRYTIESNEGTHIQVIFTRVMHPAERTVGSSL